MLHNRFSVLWCRCRLVMATGFIVTFSTFMAVSVATAGPTETEVLEVMTTKGIDAHLINVVETGKSLEKAVQQLCTGRDDKALLSTRNAWKKAHLAWRSAAPYLIEPADTLADQIGKPINDIVLEAVVNSDEFVDLRRGPDVRGYRAVEYLLFAPKSVDETVGNARCAHLADVTCEIVTLTTEAKEQWDKEFRQGFISAGDGLPYLLPGDAMSLVVAETLNTLEKMLRDEISIPSNFFKGKAKPELLDAPYSKSTREGFLATIEGVESVLAGEDNIGLLELVATKDGLSHQKNPALSQDIEKQLDKVKKMFAKMENKNVVFYQALERDSKALKKVYKHLDKLQKLIAEAALVLELNVRAGLEAQLTRQ